MIGNTCLFVLMDRKLITFPAFVKSNTWQMVIQGNKNYKYNTLDLYLYFLEISM